MESFLRLFLRRLIIGFLVLSLALPIMVGTALAGASWKRTIIQFSVATCIATLSAVIFHEVAGPSLDHAAIGLSNRSNQFIKRFLDILISLPIVIFVLPPMCLWVWIMQQLQAPGPLFVRNSDESETEGLSSLLHFRSRYSKNNASHNGKSYDLYPFGIFLKRSSLDEVPQFFLVLIGKMSVIGPPIEWLDVLESFPGLKGLMILRPGIFWPFKSNSTDQYPITQPTSHEDTERLGLTVEYTMKWTAKKDWAAIMTYFRNILRELKFSH